MSKEIRLGEAHEGGKRGSFLSSIVGPIGILANLSTSRRKAFAREKGTHDTEKCNAAMYGRRGDDFSF